MVRIYDPRQKKPTSTFVAHDGAKGTYLCFMESNRLLTVGFSKSVAGKSARNMSIWDVGGGEAGNINMAQAATKVVAENNFSAMMVPYYDPATGVAYLTGRGNAIFYYEINNSGEMIFPIGQGTTSISYTGAAPAPKRSCDVTTCEIERFYLVSTDAVAMTSIICPRKSSQTIFQEDLYPAVPAAESSITVEAWMAGKDALPVMVSMKPKDLPSIFDVSKEEGGKSRTDEIEKIRTRSSTKASLTQKDITALLQPAITEGSVQVYTGGWLRKWGDRWMELGKDFLYVYEAKDGPSMSLCLPLDAITKVGLSVAYDVHDARLFSISASCLGEDEHFYCPSSTICEKWIESITLRREQLTQDDLSVSNLPIFSQSETDEPQEKKPSPPTAAPTTGNVLMEGWLEMYLLGYIYNGWVSRYLLLTSETLFVYQQANTKTNNPLEILHMPKMIAVSQSEEDHPNRAHTFKLCTATRIIHLAAGSFW